MDPQGMGSIARVGKHSACTQKETTQLRHTNKLWPLTASIALMMIRSHPTIQYVAKVSVTCVANYYFSGYCAQHRIFLRKILFAKSTYNINTFTHRFKNIFNLVKYELCFNFFWWVWWAFRFVVNFKANWSLAMSLSLILSTRNFGILKFNYIWLIMQSFAFSWGIEGGIVATLLHMAYFGAKIQHTSIFGY